MAPIQVAILFLISCEPASRSKAPNLPRTSGHSNYSKCVLKTIALRAKTAQIVSFPTEITMPQPNPSKMDVQSLIELRTQINETLLRRRAEIQKQLERMDGAIAIRTGPPPGKARTSLLKGRKVAPKYRGPSGETWAGRGAKPRWLVAAIKEGRKLDDFSIDKSPTKRRKKRRSKR